MERHPVLPLHQSRSLPFQHPIAICEESGFFVKIPRFVYFFTINLLQNELADIRLSSDFLYVFLRSGVLVIIKAGNPFAQGIQGCLGSICQVEFIQNVADMGCNRALGHMQLNCNLLIA